MVYYHPGMAAAEVANKPQRQSLLRTSVELVRLGLNRGTSGNCSIRTQTGFLITPSGVPVEDLTMESMVTMSFSGNVLGSAKPSSEWRFHRDILERKDDIGAVIHTHALAATTLACLGIDIPAFHYMVAVAGGDSIRCAPYALFGSQELSDLAIKALEDRKACLLANHGMIVLGRDLEDALAIAIEVETLSEQYLRALQAGEPRLLEACQMQEVIEKFRGYGRWNTAPEQSKI